MTKTDTAYPLYDIDNSRSYATEERLLKTIYDTFGSAVCFMTVRNRAGRWTAVFGYSWNPTIPPLAIATKGFKVIN